MTVPRRRFLALGAAGAAGVGGTAPTTPLAGHLDAAAGFGVSGHSMGGMTTHGLLTAWPDPRITAAIPCPPWTLVTPAARYTPRGDAASGTTTREAAL